MYSYNFSISKERILEKELILTEINTLTERLKAQTVEGRDKSTKAALKLNVISKKIKNTTRKMMAKVSELSIHQAISLNLYQEKTEKSALLRDAEARMKNKETPLPWELLEFEIKQLERKRNRKERHAVAESASSPPIM